MKRAELMGQIVTVHSQLHREVDYRPGFSRDIPTVMQWVSKPKSQPRAGWITGFRTLQNGDYMPGGYEDPPYLKVTSTVQAALVVFWPNQKPVEVPLDGFTLGGTPESSSYRWNERDKEMMRQEVKNWPRDEKGRFLKPETAMKTQSI